MSLLPILWAMKSAPVADAEERAILIAMAESAWSDGTDAFQSKKTIAEIAAIDPKTVQRRLKALVERGVIALGNQAAAAYIPEYYRPTVYDLMIPFSWFPDIDQVNSERKGRSKPPLTPESRPDLAPAPPRKYRADKGKRRPKKLAVPIEGGDYQGGGDYKSPGDTPSQSGQGVGTTSPGGGDYKSQTRGLQDPQPSPAYPPQDPPLPSFPASAGETDGGMDGGDGVLDDPGMTLLLAIAARRPEFLLTGKPLQDQAAVVNDLLAAGWTQKQVFQVVAGRPLPQPVRTSVGAVVASRLREAQRSPSPSAVPAQMQRAPEGETPTPDSWPEKRARTARLAAVECVGMDGMCGRPTEAGSQFCRSCSSTSINA
ncbi:helix-turn-helix domain-containing protein [Streptomyces lavendulocolor]|uniref:helix-turn-helix domain-containing protein n=1 Tax=Streptomyces lavendulocolor TaxID=67316 RepID=UPI003C2B64A9